MDLFRRIFGTPQDEEGDTSGMSNEPEETNDTLPLQPETENQETLSDASIGESTMSDAANNLSTEEVAKSETVTEEQHDTKPPEDLEKLDEQPATETEEVEEEDPGADTIVPMPGITRPLPEEATNANKSGHITYGQASDTGMVRTNNQDSALSFYFASDTVNEQPDFGIFIVADGMGGHKEGEKASSITASEVLQDIFKTVFLPMVSGEEMTSERLTIREALQQSIQKANTIIRKEVKDGGTTITALVVVGDQAHIGHVGDSRAYLLVPGGDLEQITRDHSVVQRLIELDKINEEEAEQHEQRNVLYRAIGQNEDVEPDIMRKRLEGNSYILLCSDGLWGMVNETDMKDVILQTPDPQEACNKLIALANTNGGTDNITAILLKIPSN
jgi:serine/threonine protein phosphatase PrpC